MWMIAAIMSAVFAGLTAILAKCGIKKTDSDIATALRTIVVLLFAWIMVFITGSADTISRIRPGELFFLLLSGAATGASWMCYFKALSIGDVNKVVPIDKSSTVLTVLLAMILFQETDHLAVKLAGTAMLGTGVILMVEKKTGGRKSREPRLYSLRCRIRRICRPHLHTCQNWYFQRRLQSRHRYPDNCRAGHGMADRRCQRKITGTEGSGQKRTAVYLPVRNRHRRLMAVLLLRYPKWNGQRSRTHRQNEPAFNGYFFLFCIS